MSFQEKDINTVFIEDKNLVASLQKDLATGFSGEKRYVLLTKEKTKIVACISGFYMGLISDINNKIILIVRKTQLTVVVNENPQKTEIEIDNFIYRAAHDLRGPLATIKGLIDLIKIRENNSGLGPAHSIGGLSCECPGPKVVSACLHGSIL